MKLNDFNNDLEYSNRMSDESFWEEVYRKAFPDFACCVKYSEDCEGQRMGIDRIVQLKSGRTIYIDEKKRRKVYNDIIIEFEHEYENGNIVKGWIEKRLAIDYLAYAFMPIKKVLLYDWQMLRKAWLENKNIWFQKFRIIEAINNNYITKSLAIPFKDLHKAVSVERIINL